VPLARLEDWKQKDFFGKKIATYVKCDGHDKGRKIKGVSHRRDAVNGILQMQNSNLRSGASIEPRRMDYHLRIGYQSPPKCSRMHLVCLGPKSSGRSGPTLPALI